MTTERRAPDTAHYEIEPDPRRLRAVLADVDRSIEDVDSRARHKVELLIGALVDQWLRRTPSDRERIRITIHHRPGTLRFDVSGANGGPGEDVWLAVGSSASIGIVDHWGLDRRGGSGAWFEVEHGH